MRRMLLVVLAAAALCSSAPAVSFEQVLPQDTIFFVTVRNLPDLQARLKTHQAYRIWNEPSVQRFLAKPIDRLKQEIQKVEGKTGVTVDHVWSLFHGQIGLAVSMDENADEPEWLLMADVGQDGDRAIKLIEALLEAGAREFEEPAPLRTEETFQGVTVFHLSDPDDVAEGLAPEPEVSYCIAQEVLVIGAPEAVKRTIAFIGNPPAAAFASSQKYALVRNKVSADADITGFLDVERLLTLATRNVPLPNVDGILDALGLKGLGTVAFGYEMRPDFSVGRIFVQNTGEPRGLVKLIIPQPGPLHTGKNVPAEAAAFLSARIEPLRVWTDIKERLAVVQPEMIGSINMWLDTVSEQLGERFSLEDHVLGVFGPRAAFYTIYRKPYELVSSQQSIIMVDIASKAAFEQLLGKLQRLIPPMGMLEQREYLGHTLYVTPAPPQPPMAPDADMPQITPPRPAFTYTDNAFLFVQHVEALEAHLRWLGSGGRSLADRVEFQTGLARLPAENRVLVGFQDPVTQLEYSLTVMKGGQFGMFIDMFRQQEEIAEIIDLFDLTLLPPAEDLTKHLSPTTTIAVVDQDGVLMISEMPVKNAAP